MDLCKIQFFSVGLTRVHLPDKRRKINEYTDVLIESSESKSCRRKLLTLSGIIVLAGLSGADPNNLSIFGVEPAAERISVLLLAVVAIQLYWYFLKFHHIKEDGVIESENRKLRNIWNIHFPFVRKNADLFSNYVAFILTICSWYFVASWIL